MEISKEAILISTARALHEACKKPVTPETAKRILAQVDALQGSAHGNILTLVGLDTAELQCEQLPEREDGK